MTSRIGEPRKISSYVFTGVAMKSLIFYILNIQNRTTWIWI